MKDEYIDVYGFDFYFVGKEVDGDLYQIVKDGNEICEKACTCEQEIFAWGAQHAEGKA